LCNPSDASGDAFSYRGLEEIVRRTEIHFAPAPVQLTAFKALFKTVPVKFKTDVVARAGRRPR